MRILLFPVVILLLTAAPIVDAREAYQYRFSITPVIGYRMGGSVDGENDAGEQTGEEISLDDASTLGLIINAPFQDLGGAYTEWEFSFNTQSVGLDEAPDAVDRDLKIDITHYLVGGTYVGGEGAVRPYLAAGIGAAHLSPDAPGYESDTVFGFGIGIGAHFFPESRVGLRLEGRAMGSVLDNDSAVFCASGPTGSGCAFLASGEWLLQWEVMAGATFRF
jgi:opacity protein-like surface antigen